MREDTLRLLERDFQRFPFLRAEPVPEEEVNGASDEVGVAFSPDYREFVKLFGGAIVGAFPIIGLRAAEPMGRRQSSVVVATQHFRDEEWPGADSWAVISIDQAGNPIGLAADGSIWISDHDFGQVQRIAGSFEEFLRKWCLKADA